MKKVATTLALTLLAGAAHAQLIAGNDQTTPSREIWLIDITGATPPVALVTGTQATCWGMAFDPTTQTLWWNDGSTLYRAPFIATGGMTPTLVTSSAGAPTGLAYDSAAGKLYGRTSAGFVEYDQTTGAPTVVFAATGQDFGGFDYDPGTDAFYVSNDSTSTTVVPNGRGIYRVNKPISSPTFTFIAPYPSGDTDIDGLAAANGKIYLVNDNSSPQGIYVVDMASGAYETPIPNPFTGTNGIFSGGAWVHVVQPNDVGVGINGPATCTVGQGNNGDYTVLVRNPGTAGVTGAVLTFTFPASTSFVASNPAGNVSGQTLTVNLGALAPSSTTPVVVTLQHNAQGTVTVDAAIAIAESDPNTANNSSSVSYTVLPAQPTTAAAKGIVSSVTASATSDVPDIDGTKFASTTSGGGGFDRIFRSPDGSRWIVSADTDFATTTQDMVLLAKGPTGVHVVAREGDPDPEGDLFGVFDAHYGINNAGQFTFSTNTPGATTSDETVYKWAGAAFVTVAREGSPIPSITPAVFGATSGSAQIRDNGTVTFYTTMTGNTGGTVDDTAVLANDANAVAVREATTVPTGQAGGTTFTVKAIDTGATDGKGYYTNADGSRHLWTGTINAPTASDSVVVVDNDVKIQEDNILPGLSSPINTINYGFMESNGDWFSYGANDDTNDWVVRNGTVVATTDTAITPSATESWDDTAFAQTFFLALGNNRGDFVVGGTTNSGNVLNDAAIVLNGVTVLARENDPVDLDNNGVFDDNAYIKVFRDDFGVLTDSELIIVVRLRSAAQANGCAADSADIGQAIISIPLPSTCPGNQCGPADYNGDGDVGTDQDIEAFFACLGGNCCPTCWCQGADFNGDGDVGTDQDIEAYFRVLGGGTC